MVRVSGPLARGAAEPLFPALPARPGRIARGALLLPGWPPAPAEGLFFRAPRSYTGEDLVELWVPGSPPLVRRLLIELGRGGARQAGPGEFTRRAFLAGRLDLAQVEAVLALVRSEDAARALQGGPGPVVDALKERILGVLAHVEAAIDFSEEELELASGLELAARLRGVAAELAGLIERGGRRPGAGTEPRVVLRGPANAGKSTLLNALAGTEAALVSPLAGTTRDPVEARLTLGPGQTARLVDTAGDSEARDAVEERALDAAAQAARTADLVLQVLDGRDERAASLLERPGDLPRLVVLTRADLLPHATPGPGAGPWVRVSGLTGEGLPALRAAIAAHLTAPAAAAPELVGTARQEALVEAARAALERAADLLGGRDPARAELAAIDLGQALEALGELTGAVTTDDLLDRIFSAFCIGK